MSRTRRLLPLLLSSVGLLLAGALLPSCSPAASPDNPPQATATASARATATPSSKEDIAPEAATGLRDVDAATAGHFMVAAANPHAAAAGRAVLREGGSAVDAAVAMALVLTLVEPQSSGIGGGAFLLHYDAKGKQVRAYDGRETAPAAASGELFLDKRGNPRKFYDAVIGGLSVGVPGELRMLEMAHKKHGKLPWKRLFEPAIKLAAEGFELSPRLYALLDRNRYLRGMKVARKHYYQDNGKPYPVGHKLRNPALANTLLLIAEGGAKAFYEGPIADDIVAATRNARKNPGRLTKKDLAGYKAVERTAVCRPYRQYRVCGMPPPTSGGVTTLQILGMLQRFDMKQYQAGSVDSVHLVSEASRLAFADRGLYLADSDFVKVPVEALLAPAYLEKRSKLISSDKALDQPSAGSGPGLTASRWAPDQSSEVPATSHLVAVDKEGHVVSMTASIESAFGSHVMVRGFLLNNELTDFSFVPSADGKPVANRVQPNKRPRSSMAPIIVLDKTDNRFHLAVGSPGGSRIIGFVTRVLVDVLDHRLPLQKALSRPHFANRNGPTELERMPGQQEWLTRTKKGLEARGHQVRVGDMTSGLHAIIRTEKGYVGAADPRREGVVLGE